MSAHQIRLVGVCLCVAAAIPATAFGQQGNSSGPAGGPLTGPPVLDAPFSADATTTVQQTLSDGTRIARSGTAHYYRDRAGRVRVEQTLIGLDALNQAADRQVRITVDPEPGKGWVYTLDPLTRTAGKSIRSIAGAAVGGGDTVAVPLGGIQFLVFRRLEDLRGRYGLTGAVDQESLGNRRMAGVEVTGQRLTITIPAGEFGNDRPMQLVDERWESPELKMVIYSRHSDPRTGVVEYRLTNIRRAEPSRDLFVIPEDYTIVGSPGIDLKFAEPADRAKGGGGQQQ